mmetsp:Transcript_11840/g.31830  ORF Transcript_11840/g.31830 Transcript_11840/m.31830 type:complete len:103 (-) Transcript_11840:357-665(-)
MDWHVEAEAHVQDVRGGVASAVVEETVVPSSSCAHVRLTTLEDTERLIRLDEDGFTEEPSTPASKTYDTLHSLLINESPGYKAHFNEGLRERLQALVDAADA